MCPFVAKTYALFIVKWKIYDPIPKLFIVPHFIQKENFFILIHIYVTFIPIIFIIHILFVWLNYTLILILFKVYKLILSIGFSHSQSSTMISFPNIKLIPYDKSYNNSFPNLLISSLYITSYQYHLWYQKFGALHIWYDEKQHFPINLIC